MRSKPEIATPKDRRVVSERKASKDLPNPLTFTGFQPIIWVWNGNNIYELDNITFTIYEDGNTQYTLSWNATSHGWQSIRDPHCSYLIEIQDAQGGVLDSWDVQPGMPCGGPTQQVFTNPSGKPNILKNSTLQVTITSTAGGFTEC